MTKEERKAYMKLYNQTDKAKEAKKIWRISDSGIKYMKNYHVERMSDSEKKKQKLDKQKIHRRTSLERKLIDSSYSYDYCRRKEVKDRKNKKRRERRKTDISYRLSERIRSRVKSLLGKEKPEYTSKSLGCTSKELKNYLESKWLEGMNWDNYGLYGWHIDHIRPLSSFNLKNLEEYRVACHYTNLQPLWAKDNLKKSNKV